MKLQSIENVKERQCSTIIHRLYEALTCWYPIPVTKMATRTVNSPNESVAETRNLMKQGDKQKMNLTFLLCSLRTGSCWPRSEIIIAQGCIFSLPLSMIPLHLRVIISKKGIKSHWQALTLLGGNDTQGAPSEFPGRYKGGKKSPSQLKWATATLETQDLCSWRCSELVWTKLWATWSNITAWYSFEADLSRSWTRRLGEPPPSLT